MNRLGVGHLLILLTMACSSVYGQAVSRTETIEYSDNPSLWVLGQVSRTTINGVEVSRTDYDASTALPDANYSFGQLKQTQTYNADGTLATRKDGNNNITGFKNYYRGISQEVDLPATPDQPLGSKITASVDALGEIVSITDAAGAMTCYGYDAMGRINLIKYPKEGVPNQCDGSWNQAHISFSPGYPASDGLPAGHWRQRITTGNAMTETLFDGLWRPVVKQTYDVTNVNATISQTVSRYDTNGNVSFLSYPQRTSDSAITNTWGDPTEAPNAAGTTSLYDALNRVTSVTDDAEAGVGPITTTTSYLSGFKTQITDPNQQVMTISYMTFDEPATDWPVRIDAPGGVTQVIGRDIYGSPISITQSGPDGVNGTVSLTKSMVYDSQHRLCRTTEPESLDTVMAYDGADNIQFSVSGYVVPAGASPCGSETVPAAARTTFTYDALNRVTTIQPPAGTQSTTYHYDPVGRTTSAATSAASGNTLWNGVYNFRGLLTGESLQVGGLSPWAIGYGYDPNGNASLIHYPDGENVSYLPDALGHPTQVGSYANSIRYFPNGQVNQFFYGNGSGYVASQNTRQLLSNFSYGAGSAMQLSEDLVYDKNANITTVTDLLVGGPRNKSFRYDALNRLSSATANGLWGTQTYAYDAINNLRTLQTGSQVSTYNYTNNRLTSITNAGSTIASFGYDARGNENLKNGVTWVFDAKNQLLQVLGSDTYAYDAAGRRITKTAGSTSTYYFYSQAGQLMYQWVPSLAQSTDFIYLGKKIIARDVGTTLSAPATIGFDANPSNGSVTVSWGAVPAATSYLLQESANGGAWTTVYSASALSVTLSGKAGGSYGYRVEACIGTTCSAFTISATLGVRPTLPTVNVPTGTINGAYTVSWTAPATTSSYTVQERLNAAAWNTIASNTTATSISRPGTTSGSYTYQVSASNAYGSRGWALSGAVTVDTTYGVLPTMPASFTVPASSNNGSASLSWSAATQATRYVVQQSSNGGTSWTGIYNSAGTSTALSGLANGNYVFQVQACNTYGCSAWKAGSATLVVTYPPATAPMLSVPATSPSGSYTVSWNAVSTATSYTLQEQVNGGIWATIQSSALLSDALNAKGNGGYGYRVQACNVGGCGAWSSTNSVIVLLPPPAPTSISVPATSSGSVAVSWATSSTATSYNLQHRIGAGSWVAAYSGAATSSTVNETSSGSYTYQVTACNTGGCSAFKLSSAVIVTVPPASAPALSVPASSGTGSYTVSWGAMSGATTYTLQEQVNGGAWTTIQASGATSDAISGKGNGSYGYRAQACNTGGCGPWSSTGTIMVALAPPAPTSVQVIAEPGVPTRYLGAWAPVSGATRYEIFSSQTNNTIYSGTQTSFIIETVSVGGGRNYMEEVRACNASGCSAYVVFPN